MTNPSLPGACRNERNVRGRLKRCFAAGVLLLGTLVPVSAFAQSMLDFSDATPATEPGSPAAGTLGAVHRFQNVAPGVDALVTLAVFNNVISPIAVLDDNTTDAPRFQPTLTCATVVNSSCYVRFNFQLVAAGTTTPAPRPGLIVSAQDVDSTGTAATNEFIAFPGATAVQLNTVTPPTPASYLTQTGTVEGSPRFIHTGGQGQAAIGTDDRFEVYGRYAASTSAFSVVGGNTIGTSACGADNTVVTCRRLNSYSFNTVDSNLAGITVTKVSQGGIGTFAFTGTNGYASESITTQTAGTGRAGLVQALAAVGTATTITEAAPPAGYRLASIACTGLGAGGTATPSIPGTGTSGGSVILNAAATVSDTQIACTFTNVRLPTVTVTKVSNGGVGTFAFSGDNGFAAQNITTATSGTGVAGATQTLTAASTATRITESAPPAGFVLSAISCTGLGAGGTATPTINGSGGGFVDLSALATAPGSNIACTFTNTALGSITIVKDAQPDNAQDFTFVSSEAPLGTFLLDDDADGTLPNARTFGNLAAGTYTVTESATPGWTLASINCNDADGGTTTSVAARNAVIDLDPGQNITCTFVNGATGLADLQIVKTNNNSAPLVAGTTTTYVLTVTNNGPAPVNGAVVYDSPNTPAGATGPGLNCPAANPVTCSPAAACPAGTTVGNLTGPGVTLGNIANGGAVTLSFSCNVQ
jgi:uncharacterized repeat protein (TIGR01451 family)